MPIAPATLTNPPASPDRADVSTFSARAVALDDFTKNVHVPEMQANVTNVYNNAVETNTNAINAAASAVSALAGANFKGNWSALTGALNMPASVAHNGNFWALNTNLANVTTATPGVSASWTSMNVGAGGALETTSAVDITLTAASFRVQAVNMTVTDKSVTLPAATGLPLGGEIFVIKNTGSVVFCARDSAYSLLATVDVGQTVLLYLTNNGTSAGVWAVSNLAATALAQSIYQATALNVNAVSATCLAVTAMSATQAIVVWGDSAGGYACTLTLTGNVISAGTTLNFSPASGPQHASVCAMSTTQAVVAIQGGSVFLSAYTLNVSGTTLTAGALLTVNAVSSSFISVAALSATQAVCAYVGTTSFSQAVTLNVSGTTLTNGAVLSVSSAAMSNVRVAAMSSVQAVVVQNNGSGLVVQTLDVSGTTVTAGAVLLIATNASAASIAPNSSAKAALGYVSSSVVNNVIFRELYVSGTTCSLGPPTVQVLPYRSALGFALARVSATKFSAIYPSDSGDGSSSMQAQVLNLADVVLSAGPPMPIKTSLITNANYSGIASMSANRQLVVYRNPSGFVQARILEIGA